MFKSKALAALVHEELAFLETKHLPFNKLTEEQQKTIIEEAKMIMNTETFSLLIDYFVEQYKERIIKGEDPDYNRAAMLVLLGFKKKMQYLANKQTRYENIEKSDSE